MRKVVQLKTGRLEVEVRASSLPLDDLCGFASRNNPARGYLFVSKVLGKHHPVRPAAMQQIYEILAGRLASLNITGPVVTIGMAETATGLGQGVFECFKAIRPEVDGLFIHTTRYNLRQNLAISFDEKHCHAPEHILYEPVDRADCELFDQARTLVLVDDEISTGNTLINLALAFQSRNPHLKRIVLVSIKNWLTIARQVEIGRSLAGMVDLVSILEGQFDFAPDHSFHFGAANKSIGNGMWKDEILPGNFGRLGCREIPEIDFDRYIDELNLSKNDRLLVLGTGEFTFLPFKLATRLEESDYDVFFQSTTRSPILVDGDIQCKISFEDNYFDQIDNFVYNVRPEEYTRIIVCYETKRLPGGHDLVAKLGATPLFFCN